MFVAVFTLKHPENIICSSPQTVKYQELLPGTKISYSEPGSHFIPVFPYKHRYVHNNVSLRRWKRSLELHFPKLLYGAESMKKHDTYKFSRADPNGRTVCGLSLAGVKGSNPARGVDVCLLWVLCVVRYGSLRRANPPSRGVLLIVCVSVCQCVSLPAIGWNNKPLHIRQLGRRGHTKEETGQTSTTT